MPVRSCERCKAAGFLPGTRVRLKETEAFGVAAMHRLKDQVLEVVQHRRLQCLYELREIRPESLRWRISERHLCAVTAEEAAMSETEVFALNRRNDPPEKRLFADDYHGMDVSLCTFYTPDGKKVRKGAGAKRRV